MRLDAFCSEPQYVDHVESIWKALEPKERGTFHTRKRLLNYVASRGIEAVAVRPPRKDPNPVLVAAFSDLQSVKPRSAILLEHGAGQTYRGIDHPSYSGGPQRENVVLFLCPNDEVAARNRSRYPEAASIAVGCPKLDAAHTMMLRRREEASRWAHNPEIAGSSPVGATAGDEGPMHRERPSLTREPEPRSTNPGPVVATSTDGSGSCRDTAGRAPGTREHEAPGLTTATRPVVALSFHWDARAVAPEARWAFPHYRDALPALADSFKVLGHAHPRVFDRIRPYYEAVGIETVRSFDDVLARADVYVCDNSSSLFEFASVGKPVVLLNAPWYRRDIEHGLRFWEHARVGVQVGDPGGLIEGVEHAIEDPLEQRLAREDVCSRVYVHRDGHATDRAVFAIREVMKCRTLTEPARP